MSPVETGARHDHLGDRVASVADGALPPAELEQVLAHVAGCPACRAAVDAERAAKQWVTTLTAPELDLQLLGRLLTISPTRPVSPVSRPSLRSLAALSGAGATAAAVLLVGVTAAPAPGVAARPAERTPELRATATAASWSVPAALAAVLPAVSVSVDPAASSRQGMVRRAKPAATGLPAAFDVAAAPGPTPPWAAPVSLAVPGVTR